MICSSIPSTPPAPDDCLYSLKPAGWLLRGRARLDEALLEDGREHIVSLLEERLRGALVCDRGLEVRVLHLTVLARALELRLHLGDLGLEGRDGLGELVDLRREVRDLGLELLDVALLELRLALVRVEALRAEVLVLDLVGLLLEERRDHLVDGRLARVGVLLRGAEEHLRRRVAGARRAGA